MPNHDQQKVIDTQPFVVGVQNNCKMLCAFTTNNDLHQNSKERSEDFSSHASHSRIPNYMFKCNCYIGMVHLTLHNIIVQLLIYEDRHCNDHNIK
jgi:hypothetical protein